jgi:hypothetical protein
MLPYANLSAELRSNLTATPNITTPGIRLTASATPHAKGAYGQLIDLLPADTYGITLILSGSAASATRTDMMLDLAIGAAGQEVVILPEFLCGWKPAITTGPYQIYLPFFIPKGTRVAARIQALIASDVLDVIAFFHNGYDYMPGPFFRRADAYGTNAASSTGTSHTPGNTGVESTAANVGSALTRSYGGVMLAMNGTLATTITNAIAYHWELMIGGVTMLEWYHRSHTTEEIQGPYPSFPIPHHLPAGTQLQVRATASGTAQAHDVAFYCFY